MLVGISFLVIALDQFTKFMILHTLQLNESVPVWPDILYLTYIQNSGVGFGLLSNLGSVIRIPFFITVTLASTFFIYTYQRLIPHEKQMTRVALGLIWGGALGNLTDRLLYGQVVDFIGVRYNGYPWYAFNVADACVTAGILFLFYEFISWNHKKAEA